MKRALMEGRISPFKTETRALIAGTAIGACLAYSEVRGFNYLKNTLAENYDDTAPWMPPDLPPSLVAAIGGATFGVMWGRMARAINGDELKKD